MSLTEHLQQLNINISEGFCQQIPDEVHDLIELTNKPDIDVMEIGFNAGHSSEIFLKHNTTLKLTSFDLGEHSYTSVGKAYIDKIYPNRHTLILGNSIKTIPAFISANPTKKFDVIFIDGGHEYKIASKDLQNCMQLAHKDTIVIMDDTNYTTNWKTEWTKGPTRAWIDCIIKDKISQINKKDYCLGRGISWGKYKL